MDSFVFCSLFSLPSNAMEKPTQNLLRKFNGFFLDPPLLRLHLVVFFNEYTKILNKNHPVVPQKVKYRCIIWSSNSTSRHVPQIIGSTGSSRYLHVNVHNSTIHNNQKVEATPVPINKWRDEQMWHMHTMDYYSVLKRKEILTHVTTWVNLENMLSEISKPQKDKWHMIPLIQGT